MWRNLKKEGTGVFLYSKPNSCYLISESEKAYESNIYTKFSIFGEFTLSPSLLSASLGSSTLLSKWYAESTLRWLQKLLLSVFFFLGLSWSAPAGHREKLLVYWQDAMCVAAIVCFRTTVKGQSQGAASGISPKQQLWKWLIKCGLIAAAAAVSVPLLLYSKFSFRL